MAKIVQSVHLYGPKLNLRTTIGTDRVAEWSSMRKGLNKTEVMMSIQEFSEAIQYFAREGTPVKLPGVGIFSPSVDRNGNINLNFRADPTFKKKIGALSDYQGEAVNRDKVGLTNAEYKALWDHDHPDDPLEI